MKILSQNSTRVKSFRSNTWIFLYFLLSPNFCQSSSLFSALGLPSCFGIGTPSRLRKEREYTRSPFLSACFLRLLFFWKKKIRSLSTRQEEIDRYKLIFLMHSASTPSDHFGWLRLENPGTAINTVFVCLIKTDLCHCWRFLSSPRGYRGTGRKKQNPFTYYNPHRADLWKSKKEQGHTMGI